MHTIRTLAAIIIALFLTQSLGAPIAGTPPDTLRMAKPGTSVTDSATRRPQKKASIQTDSIGYEAQVIIYDVAKHMLHLNSLAVMRYKGMTLCADTIVYYMDDGILEAIGYPRIIDNGDTTVGESMVYNLRTKRGRVKYASTKVDGDAFNGNLIVRSPENALYIREGAYSTCAKIDSPTTFFYGRDIKVIPNKKTIVRPVVMNLGDVPVAALPYFVFPLQKQRSSGVLTPSFGGNPSNGGYLDNLGFYYAPNDYIDGVVSARVSEFENILVQASSQYSLRYWLGGNIHVRFQQDGNFMGTMQDWAVDYSHNQNLTPDGSFTLSGHGRLVSNRKFYTTYSRDTSELLTNSANAGLTLSKRFTSINASVNASLSRDNNFITKHIIDNLPIINFSLPSRPLIPVSEERKSDGSLADPQWYQKIYYSYNSSGRVDHDSWSNDSLPETWRSSASQGISLSAPQKLFKHITISPNLSATLLSFDAYIDTFATDTVIVYRTTRLTDSTSKIDTIHVPHFDTTYVHDFKTFGNAQDLSWNTGVSASTNLYGIFPIKIATFAGIRHTLSPSLSYSYSPIHEQRYNFFNKRGGAQPTQHQSVSLSFGNLFEGKTITPPLKADQAPVERSFTIVSANLSTGYNFETIRNWNIIGPLRRWSDVSLSARTSYQRLGVSFGSSFWLYDENNLLLMPKNLPAMHNYNIGFDIGAFNAAGSFWDGDKIDLNGFIPKDKRVDYLNAGMQQWHASLNPSYSISASRATRHDPFIVTRNYGLSASAGLNFTRRWSASWSSTYNFSQNQFTGNYFNFYCDLECWGLTFNWSPSGVTAGNYYFLLQLKKIPEIKWEPYPN